MPDLFRKVSLQKSPQLALSQPSCGSYLFLLDSPTWTFETNEVMWISKEMCDFNQLLINLQEKKFECHLCEAQFGKVCVFSSMLIFF